jgi:ribonuclease HI
MQEFQPQIDQRLAAKYLAWCETNGMDPAEVAEAVLLAATFSPADRMKNLLTQLRQWRREQAEETAAKAPTPSADAPTTSAGTSATSSSKAVRIFTDGGSRGNPGPAAAGVVILGAAGDTPIFAGGFYIGRATNNVAEYQGLINGLTRAAQLGATSVDVFSDSELLVRQINGQYRVKNAGLQPLYAKAAELLRGFRHSKVTHIPRERNEAADALANKAMDLRQNAGDAAKG